MGNTSVAAGASAPVDAESKRSPVSRTAKNRRKKDRQKLAREVKQGKLEPRGRLIAVKDAQQGDGISRPSSGDPPASEDNGRPPNSRKQEAGEGSRKRSAQSLRDGDSPDKPLPKKKDKPSKKARKSPKEPWHSSDALLPSTGAAAAPVPGATRAAINAGGTGGTAPVQRASKGMSAGAGGTNTRTTAVEAASSRPSKPAAAAAAPLEPSATKGASTGNRDEKRPAPKALPMVPFAVLQRQIRAAQGAEAAPRRAAGGGKEPGAGTRGSTSSLEGPSSRTPQGVSGSKERGGGAEKEAAVAGGVVLDPEAKASKGRKARPSFVYGNYSRYYGYRSVKAFDEDKRLHLMQESWFTGRRLLDIGCHEGVVTLALVQRFQPLSALGVDIDSRLIDKASWHLRTAQSSASSRIMVGPSSSSGDTRVRTEVTGEERLEDGRRAAAELSALRSTKFKCSPVQDFDIPAASFGVITLFSVAKWIHIHVGDDGMRQVFRKLAAGLEPGGTLVLEPQPIKSYRQAFRKQVMPTSAYTLGQLQFLPDKFHGFLQDDCGLLLVERLEVDPEGENPGEKGGAAKGGGGGGGSGDAKQSGAGVAGSGFNRPIFVFRKPLSMESVQEAPCFK